MDGDKLPLLRAELPPLGEGDLGEEALWAALLSGVGASVGGLDSPPAEKKFVHIDAHGDASMVSVDKHTLVHRWKLRYRDLVVVDPTIPLPMPSVLLVRARAVLVHLDAGGAIRAIVAENQVLVLSLPKASDPRVTALPTLCHPLVRRLCRCLRHRDPSRHVLLAAAGAAGAPFDDMPYELRALEVLLAAATGILCAEMDRFEENATPVVDALLRNVDKGVLEGVRGVKSGIDRLRSKVQTIHKELEELLEDDFDMRDVMLARRAQEQGLAPLPQLGTDDTGDDSTDAEGSEAGSRVNLADEAETGDEEGEAAEPATVRSRGGRHGRVYNNAAAEPPGGRQRVNRRRYRHAGAAVEPPPGMFEAAHRPRELSPSPSSLASTLVGIDPREIEDVEDLLETYYTRTDLLLRRLLLLDERIDDVEDFVEIELDQRRNEIVGLNLMVSTVSMAFGWAAALGGVFGMNLINARLDNQGWVLVVVLVAMVVVSVALLLAVALYARRRKLLFIPDRL